MINYEKTDYKLNLCLLALIFAVYFTSIFADFSFIDDPVYVYKNPLVINLKIKEIFLKSYFANYTPLALLSYCADFLLWGENPAGYHLTSLILHIVCSILLYGILFRLTKSRATAFFTAAIFAVHPVQIQTVVWISERKSILNLLFMLLSFDFYMKYMDTKVTRFYVFSVLFFILSVLSKPLTVTYFLMLIAYDLFIMRYFPIRKNIKSVVINKIPFTAVSIIVAYVTVTAQSSMGAIKQYHGGTFFTNLLTIFKGVTHYFKIMLFPKNLLFYYDITPATSLLSPSVIIGAALISALLFIVIKNMMIKNRAKNGIISFGIAIFFIFMLPVCNIVPIEAIVADRYLYIPIIGLCLSLTYYIDGIAIRRRKAFIVPALAVIIVLSFASSRASLSWMEKEGIWEDIVKTSPKNIRALNSLFEIYMSKGDRRKALLMIERAMTANPEEPKTLTNYALYEQIAGNAGRALPLMERALQLDPQNKEIYLEIARVYFDLKEYDKAQDTLLAGMKIPYEFPADTEIKYRYVLANVYVKKLMINEAVSEFRALTGLAGDYLGIRRRYELLLGFQGEFNKNVALYKSSGGAAEYKENLTRIFERLRLVEEGGLFLKKLDELRMYP